MTAKMRWMSALFALVLILAIIPLPALAQEGGPGKGNPPPGQAKEKGKEGDGGNNAVVQKLGQLAGQDNAQAGESRLVNIPGQRLIGLPIVNMQGKQIGKVDDLLLSFVGQRQSGNPDKPASGGLVAGARIDYVVARFGGTLGLGEETTLVPLSAVRLHLVDAARLGFDDNLLYFQGAEPGDNGLELRKQFFNGNALLLASDQVELRGAPQFDLNRLGDVADPTWDRNLRAYWQGFGPTWPETQVQNGAAYRLVGVRSLDKFALRELGGDALGGIQDVLVTLAVSNPLQSPLPPAAAPEGDAGNTSGDGLLNNNSKDQARADAVAQALASALPIVDARVRYALVGHGGWWGLGAKTSPLPVSMLMMDRDYDQRTAYVEANDNLLKDSPAADAKDGNDLNDPNFFNRVHAYWQEAGFGPFES